MKNCGPEGRYEELTEAMAQPEVTADYPRLQEILKERTGLEEIVGTYGEYLRSGSILRKRRSCWEIPIWQRKPAAEAAALEGPAKAPGGRAEAAAGSF